MARELRLGRPYSVSGVVISGQKLGRTLDMPTANLALEPTNRLAHGVYAVRAHVWARRSYDGVASFGVRPTVDNGAPLLEVHLFDFDADIYGHEMTVDFIARIRDELKFDSLERAEGRDGRRRRARQGDPRAIAIWRFAPNPLIPCVRCAGGFRPRPFT